MPSSGDKRAAEHVIARANRAGALQRPEIGDRLDDDEHIRVAPLIAADRAGIERIDIAAVRADEDLLARGLHRVGERRQQFLALADEMQRGAARRARAEARQARQQLDQALDFGAGDALGHRVQNGSFMPGGSGRPAVTDFIFSSIRRSAFLRASSWAVDDQILEDFPSSLFSSEGSMRSLFIAPLAVSVT